MKTLDANQITLAYETFGDAAARPLVLIMGLATQMIFWPEPFCRMLAEAGHWVIRFDNRDAGLSSKMEMLGVPDLTQIRETIQGGQSVRVPYTLSDMAADTIGLLDALNLARAHVCGLSMGGMIAQQVALEYPDRLLSLISLMSTTSERDLPPSSPDARKAMMLLPPSERVAYQRHMAQVGRAFCNDAKWYDAALKQRLAGQAFDRGLYPDGFFRQMGAILVAEGRRDALATVQTPTLVIHGSEDTVLPPAHGRDTAEAIAGARLEMIPGLGHGLEYPALWESIVGAIARHTHGTYHR